MEQNLSQYRIFYIVAKLGNISHAANELYISQPAISKAISKLEDSLNATLFNRFSRGVTLTAEGIILFEHLKTAFDAIMLGEESLKKINVLGIGHLRIGASTTLCKYLLLPFLKGFIEKNPHIKITIECQSTFHTLKLLDENKIDIALAVKPDAPKNIDFYSIGEFEDVFVSTSSYLENLNLRENINLEENKSEEEFDYELFKTANLMLLDKGNVTRLYVDNYLKMNHYEINHILEVNNMDLLIEFARISLGVACVIKEFVSEDLKCGKLIEIPLSIPINKRTVGFAYSKNVPPTNSMKSFMDFVQN